MTAKEIISQIAKENGISEQQVENDMLEAIKLGMNSPNDDTRALWQIIFPDGETPNVEAVIKFCLTQITGVHNHCKILRFNKNFPFRNF